MPLRPRSDITVPGEDYREHTTPGSFFLEICISKKKEPGESYSQGLADRMDHD